MISVAINGSTGFLGTQLCNFLSHKYNIIKLKRSDYSLSPAKLASILNGCDYIINLAGAPISGLWTSSYRKTLVNSRIETTRNLVAAISLMDPRPKLFISASGVNIYDSLNVHTEDSFLFSDQLLGKLCRDWESEALRCNLFNVPVAIIRTGLVLDKTGGFYLQIAKTAAFKFLVKFGNGKQAFPFIALEDYLRAVEFIMCKNLEGVYNLVSPQSSTYSDFYSALQKHLHLGVIVHVPGVFLKLLPGKQANLFLEGQRVLPSHLLKDGFIFRQSNLNQCI